MTAETRSLLRATWRVRTIREREQRIEEHLASGVVWRADEARAEHARMLRDWMLVIADLACNEISTCVSQEST